MLGEHTTYSNSIKFELYCDFEDSMSETIPFECNTLRDILAVNKNAETIKLTLWGEGMMKIETMEEGIFFLLFLLYSSLFYFIVNVLKNTQHQFLPP